MWEEILERGEDPASFPILNSKPDLHRDLVWIWEAYMVLSASRQMGMSSPQPIQVAEILAYTLYEGIEDDDDKGLLLHHVQHMDRVFRADFQARNSKDTPPPQPGARS